MTLNPALIQHGGQTLPQLYPEERIVLHRDSVDAEFGGVGGQTWRCVAERLPSNCTSILKVFLPVCVLFFLAPVQHLTRIARAATPCAQSVQSRPCHMPCDAGVEERCS